MMSERNSVPTAQSTASDRNGASPRLLTAREVAHELNVSLSMAYGLIQRGEIRKVGIGNCVRVRPQDLQAFIEANLSNGAQTGGARWGA